MGHTNSTANLSLPQFIGTDKPTWLGDINGAFAAIDGYAGTNDAAVAAAASDASSAISQASAAVNTANTANTTAGNASTAANNAVGVANTANAIAGTVDSKVGLLADLNTTDRSSIVNAINEVNAAIGTRKVIKTVTADGVKTYSQIFDEFYANHSDVTLDSIIVYDLGASKQIFKLSRTTSTVDEFVYSHVDASDINIHSINISSTSTYLTSANGTITDSSASVPTSGRTYTLYA